MTGVESADSNSAKGRLLAAAQVSLGIIGATVAAYGATYSTAEAQTTKPRGILEAFEQTEERSPVQVLEIFVKGGLDLGRLNEGSFDTSDEYKQGINIIKRAVKRSGDTGAQYILQQVQQCVGEDDRSYGRTTFLVDILIANNPQFVLKNMQKLLVPCLFKGKDGTHLIYGDGTVLFGSDGACIGPLFEFISAGLHDRVPEIVSLWATLKKSGLSPHYVKDLEDWSQRTEIYRQAKRVSTILKPLAGKTVSGAVDDREHSYTRKDGIPVVALGKYPDIAAELEVDKLKSMSDDQITAWIQGTIDSASAIDKEISTYIRDAASQLKDIRGANGTGTIDVYPHTKEGRIILGASFRYLSGTGGHQIANLHFDIPYDDVKSNPQDLASRIRNNVEPLSPLLEKAAAVDQDLRSYFPMSGYTLSPSASIQRARKGDGYDLRVFDRGNAEITSIKQMFDTRDRGVYSMEDVLKMTPNQLKFKTRGDITIGRTGIEPIKTDL